MAKKPTKPYDFTPYIPTACAVRAEEIEVFMGMINAERSQVLAKDLAMINRMLKLLAHGGVL